MKKVGLALVLFLVGLAPSLKAQITYQQFTAPTGTSCRTVSCTLTLPSTTAGQAFFLDIFIGNSTPITTVADSQQNIYNLLSTQTWSTSNYVERLYLVQNIKGGALAITSNLASAQYQEMYFYLYNGALTTSNPLDVMAQTKVGLAAASGVTNPLTTTSANDMLFAFFHTDGGVTQTAGAGFTGRFTTPGGTSPNGEDQNVAATGTYTATMGFSAPANYVAFFVALKAAAQPPPGQHSVTLNWNQAVVPTGSTCSNGTPQVITGNNIYRGATSGGETLLFGSTTPITTYLDKSNIVNGSTYFYQVTGVGCQGESPKSTEISVAIPTGSGGPPAAPTNVTGSSSLITATPTPVLKKKAATQKNSSELQPERSPAGHAGCVDVNACVPNAERATRSCDKANCQPGTPGLTATVN